MQTTAAPSRKARDGTKPNATEEATEASSTEAEVEKPLVKLSAYLSTAETQSPTAALLRTIRPPDRGQRRVESLEV